MDGWMDFMFMCGHILSRILFYSFILLNDLKFHETTEGSDISITLFSIDKGRA